MIPHPANWVYLAAYTAGLLWLAAWECLAVWVDRGRGDTMTEFVRPFVLNPRTLQWWCLMALMLWATYHLLFNWLPRLFRS